MPGKKRVITTRMDHSALRKCKDCSLVQRIDEFPLCNRQLGRAYYRLRCAKCEYKHKQAHKAPKVEQTAPVNFNQLLAAFRPERKQ